MIQLTKTRACNPPPSPATCIVLLVLPLQGLSGQIQKRARVDVPTIEEGTVETKISGRKKERKIDALAIQYTLPIYTWARF
jgi:hypothetical protein